LVNGDHRTVLIEESDLGEPFNPPQSLNQRADRIDEEIHVKACDEPDVRTLPSLTGVDVYNALLMRSEITWFMISRREPYEPRNEKRYHQKLNTVLA